MWLYARLRTPFIQDCQIYEIHNVYIPVDVRKNLLDLFQLHNTYIYLNPVANITPVLSVH